MLGPLHFEHAGSADVLSVKITTVEDLPLILEESGKMVKPSSVDKIHIILKSSAISSLYDEIILKTFFEALKPGAEASIHVLGSVDMPVQPADVDEVRASLIMSGLFLEEEGKPEDDEGGWALTARKPDHATIDEEVEEDEES